MLEEGEEWIYDDGESAEIPAYTAKKDEINKKALSKPQTPPRLRDPAL